tara:strand:- start:5873 stop:6550 length:678 start_codon:yes stop_codon:yes gene_type:complete
MNLRPYLQIILIALFASAALSSLTIRSGHADVPVADNADSIEPLQVGDRAPRFKLRDVDGALVEFDPQSLQRPIVLLAYRGGWCPFCNSYLSDMRHVIPEIRKLGVDVWFLSGDRPDQLFASLSMETQSDIAGLDYTLLSDADAQASMALGIAFRASSATIKGRHEKGQDIEGSSMQKHAVLPVPAVFAIDTDGVIRFAFTNANYKHRLPADKLLVAAELIAAAD